MFYTFWYTIKSVLHFIAMSQSPSQCIIVMFHAGQHSRLTSYRDWAPCRKLSLCDTAPITRHKVPFHVKPAHRVGCKVLVENGVLAPSNIDLSERSFVHLAPLPIAKSLRSDDQGHAQQDRSEKVHQKAGTPNELPYAADEDSFYNIS